MPFTQPHMLLSFGGPIGQTARLDNWSVGIRLGQPGNWSEGELPPTDPTQFPPQYRADLIAAVRALWLSTGARMRSDAVLEWIKFNRIGTDGRYVSSRFSTTWDVERTPGVAAAPYPQQISAATTYRTPVRRGRASRGRTYWPTGLPYDAETGGLAEGSRSGLAGAVGGFLTTIGNKSFEAGFALVPCVMSNLGTGAINRISRVECGSRFDIQTRRDNAEAELYTGQAVAAPDGYVDPVQEPPLVPSAPGQ